MHDGRAVAIANLRRMNPTTSRFTAAICGGLLAACAVVERPPLEVATLAAGAEQAAAAHRETVDRVIEALASRALRRGDGHLDILLLSGGGQNGAYGAGFLRGWRERTDDPMPTFDLVTGISAGSLQAPFALLGTDQAVESLARLFRDADRSMAPKFDRLFWLRRTGGVLSTRGYYAALRAIFDQGLADTLKPEFAADRQLLVGTTDADLGVGRVWDIGRELGATHGVERFQQVLMASTAIPGVFPALLLEGHLHVDGGVMGSVLPVLALEDYRRLGARLRERGAGPTAVRLWVVLNVSPHAPLNVVPPASARAIAARGANLLIWAQQPQILRGLAELASAVGAEASGLTLEVRATAIPDRLSGEAAAAKLFDPEWIERLEAVGYERGVSATPWDPVPSAFAR